MVWLALGRSRRRQLELIVAAAYGLGLQLMVVKSECIAHWKNVGFLCSCLIFSATDGFLKALLRRRDAIPQSVPLSAPSTRSGVNAAPKNEGSRRMDVATGLFTLALWVTELFGLFFFASWTALYLPSISKPQDLLDVQQILAAYFLLCFMHNALYGMLLTSTSLTKKNALPTGRTCNILKLVITYAQIAISPISHLIQCFFCNLKDIEDVPSTFWIKKLDRTDQSTARVIFVHLHESAHIVKTMVYGIWMTILMVVRRTISNVLVRWCAFHVLILNLLFGLAILYPNYQQRIAMSPISHLWWSEYRICTIPAMFWILAVAMIVVMIVVSLLELHVGGFFSWGNKANASHSSTSFNQTKGNIWPIRLHSVFLLVSNILLFTTILSCFCACSTTGIVWFGLGSQLLVMVAMIAGTLMVFTEKEKARVTGKNGDASSPSESTVPTGGT